MFVSSWRVSFSLLVVSSLLVVCTTDEPGDTQGSGESESESTTTTTMTTTTTTSETSEGSETSETQGETSDTQGACELPENASPNQGTTFTIRNERDVAIYASPYSSFGCNYGQVEIEVGGEPVLWHHAGTYAYDCSGSLCDYGCSDGGAMGLIINPGAEAQIEWTGGVWRDTPLSEACAAEQDCLNDPGPSCSVLEVLESEAYTVRLNLTDFCPNQDECMACDEGVCEVFYYEPGPGEIIESVELSASFPTGVDFVID